MSGIPDTTIHLCQNLPCIYNSSDERTRQSYALELLRMFADRTTSKISSHLFLGNPVHKGSHALPAEGASMKVSVMLSEKVMKKCWNLL